MGIEKNVAPNKGVSILDQHECWYRVSGQAMHHVPGVPMNTAQEKALHYKIQCTPREIAGADAFIINNKTCVVDYHNNSL